MLPKFILLLDIHCIIGKVGFDIHYGAKDICCATTAYFITNAIYWRTI